MNPRIADLPDATFREPADANAHAGTASSTQPAVADSSGVVTRIIDAPDVVLVGSAMFEKNTREASERLQLLSNQ